MFKWAEDMSIFPNKTQMSKRFHVTDHQGNANRAPKQPPPRPSGRLSPATGTCETWARGGPGTLLVPCNSGRPPWKTGCDRKDTG